MAVCRDDTRALVLSNTYNDSGIALEFIPNRFSGIVHKIYRDTTRLFAKVIIGGIRSRWGHIIESAWIDKVDWIVRRIHINAISVLWVTRLKESLVRGIVTSSNVVVGRIGIVVIPCPSSITEWVGGCSCEKDGSEGVVQVGVRQGPNTVRQLPRRAQCIEQIERIHTVARLRDQVSINLRFQRVHYLNDVAGIRLQQNILPVPDVLGRAGRVLLLHPLAVTVVCERVHDSRRQ